MMNDTEIMQKEIIRFSHQKNFEANEVSGWINHVVSKPNNVTSTFSTLNHNLSVSKQDDNVTLKMLRHNRAKTFIQVSCSVSQIRWLFYILLKMQDMDAEQYIKHKNRVLGFINTSRVVCR